MKAEHGPMNHNCPDVCAEKSSIFSFQLAPPMLVDLGSVEAPLPIQIDDNRRFSEKYCCRQLWVVAFHPGWQHGSLQSHRLEEVRNEFQADAASQCLLTVLLCAESNLSTGKIFWLFQGLSSQIFFCVLVSIPMGLCVSICLSLCTSVCMFACFIASVLVSMSKAILLMHVSILSQNCYTWNHFNTISGCFKLHILYKLL